jgi:hypothetical protein
LTSQLTTIEFDVTSDGYHVTNLRTGQVNMGCTPHLSLYGGDINTGSFTMIITSAGDFGLESNDNGTIGGVAPYAGHTKLLGHLNGPTATGTVERTLSFTYSGTAFACGSGLQTWTVSRIS